MRHQLFLSREAALRGSTLAVFDCFLVLGLLGVYLKLALLGPQWEAIARFFGKIDASELTLLERLGFFFDDILLHLLIVPVVATTAVIALTKRFRLAVALPAILGLVLFYFLELRAHAEVGQYISGDALNDLAGWAVSNPSMAGDYLTGASVVKLLALVAAVLGVGLAGLFADRSRSPLQRPARAALLTFAALVVVGALVLAPVSYANRLEGSSLNQSAVARALSTLFAGSNTVASVSTFDAALAASAALTRTAPFDAAHAWVGRESDSDVIVFMMETGPAQALDFAADGRDLPGAGALMDRAFVAQRHFTTHPYSSDAVYSVLSGLYPQGRRRLLRGILEGDHLGMMAALAKRMPMRRVYVPSLYNIENDDEMYLGFGAEAVYASDLEPSDAFAPLGAQKAEAQLAALESRGSRFSAQTRARLRKRLEADLQALERMKTDITAAVRGGSRYWAMFFPEIGHGPWVALNGETSNRERGRSLMRLQDLWLEEIVGLLRELGRLDHTVIVVTADHGVRTRVEEPELPIGRISEYTFRVPLLVYAPRTLDRTVVIEHPTSHIDVAPTLLALVGEAGGIDRMQGVPLWQRTGADRIYVLASAYGGADGYTEAGTYYMRQALSGAIYRSRTFAFDDASQVRPGDPDAAVVAAALDDQEALQHALVARALDRRD